MDQALMVLAKIVALALCLESIVLHEIVHAVAAFRLGDPTGAQMGRIMLNPIKHIDPVMTIVFPLVTFLASSQVPPAKPGAWYCEPLKAAGNTSGRLKAASAEQVQLVKSSVFFLLLADVVTDRSFISPDG
jgi:Zn-dependent protease